MLPGYLGAAWIKLAAIVPAALTLLLVQVSIIEERRSALDRIADRLA